MVPFVVAYDISDNKTRKKVETCLRNYGIRVNFSVFECTVKQKNIKKMKLELEELIDPGDDIKIYRLCKSCFLQKEAIGVDGNGSFKADKSLVYV